MTFLAADPISLTLFIVFAVAMFTLCLRALKLGANGSQNFWIALFIALVLLFSVCGFSGLVATHFVPFGPALFAMVFIFAITFAFSSAGLTLATSLPFTVLIGFQGFRLLLEVLFHHWASIGTIPTSMTWTGQNWDVLAGFISIASLPVLNRSRAAAVVANTVGFLFLINVFRVVILSSPLPFSWPLERPLLLIAFFPYCLIGPLFVMPALVAHLITFRKLWATGHIR